MGLLPAHGCVAGKRILQLGGSGQAVQALLLAGAAEALLLTPMVGEAEVATEVAKLMGVADRFRCLIAVAEEIPLADSSVDVAFSAGCVHHMRTEIAFPEIARVLRSGGQFTAVEPWRAPFSMSGPDFWESARQTFPPPNGERSSSAP